MTRRFQLALCLVVIASLAALLLSAQYSPWIATLLGSCRGSGGLDAGFAAAKMDDRLAACDPRKADFVKLRYFAGFSVEEAAEVLGVSVRTPDRNWDFARAWLHREIGTG